MDASPYTTLNIAAADAGTLVLQSFMHARRILSCTVPLAEVAATGAGDAARLLGLILFATLSASTPVLRRYPRLLAIAPPRQLEHATMDAPLVRPARLCACIATDPDRLVLARSEQPDAADVTVATLSLARLALAGPDQAGYALLHLLATLHPDAFAPFPALRRA